MKKRFLTCLMVLPMVLMALMTLTACGGDDDDNNEAHSDNADDDENGKEFSSLKHKASKFGKDDSSGQAVEKNGSKKRPKIVEMA